MAVSATLLTWQPGQSICACMLPASSVDDVKIRFLQLFQPLCQLTFWLIKILQPGERSMVSAEEKALSHKVGMEMPGESNHTQ